MPHRKTKTRTLRAKRNWGRIVAIALLLFGFAVTIWAFVFYQYPNATPVEKNEYHGNFAFPSSKAPPVSFYMISTFEAKGGFGADNPITIHVKIYGANITNLLQFYCCVTYTDAYSLNATATAGFVPSGYLHLKDLGNGTYTAQGQLEWHVGEETWSLLLPQFQSEWTTATAPSLQKGIPTITIGPLSDTQNWQSIEFQTRVGFALIGFAPLGGEQALQRILGGDD